jgi:hypothetical protein
MRFLSKTAENGWVVEMTAAEVNEFKKLILAVEGKEITDQYYLVRDPDYFYAEQHVEVATALDAIRSFYSAHFRLNEVERAYLTLKSAIFPDKK